MCPYRRFTEGVYNAITTGDREGITAEYLVSQMEAAFTSDGEDGYTSIGKKLKSNEICNINCVHVLLSTTHSLPVSWGGG